MARHKLKESDHLPSEAQRLKDRIRKDSARRPRKQCGKCNHQHFHWHEKCYKWILVVLDMVVYAIRCVICRWRCVNCGATFRHLPSICVAFKRYLRVEIETRSRAYLETDPMTYRKVAADGGAAVVYDAPIADAQSTAAEKEDENVPQMSHTTPYRWISGIAASHRLLQPVVKQARQADFAGRLSTVRIAAPKYRGEARKKVLEACCLLLRALRLVSQNNPTELETRGASP